MLELDVTLTDLLLAVECGTFSTLLFRQPHESPFIQRYYAALFCVLGVSSLFGGLWHGFFSDSETALGNWVWFCVMAALALAAALLWLISAAMFASAMRTRLFQAVAFLQLSVQLSVSAFITDSFAVAAIGFLPPLSVMIAGHVTRFGRAHDLQSICGAAGFTLAALAGLIIVFEISFHPRWATTQAVYHMFQFVAFWLIFLSVPTACSHAR